MRLAHLLCEDDGITAELLLGALVDAGAPAGVLQAALDDAGAQARLVAEPGEVREVTATRVRIETEPDAPRVESFPALKERLAAARLAPRADHRVRAVAEALGRAEAAVHGVPLDAVRFHELGRPHSVARLIAAAVALEQLDVDEVSTSRVAVGGGVIRIAHGRFPVPPPAVLHLLQGFVIHGGGQDRELTTPSGAAMLAGLATPATTVPAMRLETHGRGAIEEGDATRLLTVMIGSGEPRRWA